MAPRSSWKGFLRLSLVSVPVKAFTAHQTGAEIRLNQLHKDCHARVKYRKVCPEHGELQSDEIVSGYEYAKGQYVVIDPDEIAKLRPESDQSVHIDGFFDPAELDAMYHAGKTYYLTPDGPVGQKPYALLRQGMVDGGVHALGQVVIAGREQLVAIRPVGKLLVMTVLYHDAKVKGVDAFEDELVESALSKEELKLTKTLIDASTKEELDFSTYRDEYVEKLTKIIQAKVDGQEIVQVPDVEEPKIINLMDALKKSIEQTREPVAKKMAPSTRTTRKKATRKKKSG